MGILLKYFIVKLIMDKSKSFCEICKLSVPNQYFSKHLSSERHLRSKAAKMFYQSKSKAAPYKRSKYEDSVSLNNPNFSLVKDAQISTINSEVKGVWTIVKDSITGRSQYKNRLSGKVQSNKPIGLKDEGLSFDTFDPVTVGDYEKEVFNYDQEFEEPEIGKWVDTENSHWFGGKDHEKSEENSIEEMDTPHETQGKTIRKFEWKGEEIKSEVEITEVLKQQLEDKQSAAEILGKAVYPKALTAGSSFTKRSHKGKSIL